MWIADSFPILPTVSSNIQTIQLTLEAGQCTVATSITDWKVRHRFAPVVKTESGLEWQRSVARFAAQCLNDPTVQF